MKTSAIVATLFIASTTLAQNGDSCSGSVFNNYCCENGSFSGPVISSFLGSFSTRDASRSSLFASRDSSLSAAQSSLEASLSSAQASREASITSAVNGAVITARAVLRGRAVTTEVEPGLTCVGDGVSMVDGGELGTSTGPSATESTATGVGAGTASTSTAGAAFVTQAPALIMGAAAFAYAAM
ncbi:hypothetical protein BKA64DRAFT_747718 [Cadophora sp. MPI-SDFR-AT-0126]|nr:hypothetical protein BKA64DRAFT_747718 [Leotiomycetes sp. MPI-SDFR-AT-0126]